MITVFSPFSGFLSHVSRFLVRNDSDSSSYIKEEESAIIYLIVAHGNKNNVPVYLNTVVIIDSAYAKVKLRKINVRIMFKICHTK